MQVRLGTSKNLVLWLLWSHLYTQAGGAGVFGVPLPEPETSAQTAERSRSQDASLRSLALGSYPSSASLPGRVWLTSPSLCLHLQIGTNNTACPPGLL